jgi:ppGpp synthetase/RelA/SpoT-type nucleotidyltranferase
MTAPPPPPRLPPGEGDVPQVESQYPEWLEKNLQYSVSEGKVEYQAASARLLSAISASPFWRTLRDNITAMHERYKIATGLDLFYKLEMPALAQKSYESFLSKTYRRNFIKKQHGGTKWFEPSEWYEGIDDIVRTRFVVKYLDGVDSLLRELDGFAEANALDSRIEMKANDSGYYAAHFYISQTIDIPLVRGGIRRINCWVELQITTQLQEVLLTFLHLLYETKRISPLISEVPWQWRYKEDEFFTNYLGHMLHNIEGMIMEVRRRQEERHAGIR